MTCVARAPAQLLILDEADRILDMGFEEDINSIVRALPAERQTMLFSATQTRSVRDLSRLSLSSPEYVAVHEKAETATPDALVRGARVGSMAVGWGVPAGGGHAPAHCALRER